MTNLVFAILFTNTFVMEVRHPAGFSPLDQVFVTNVVYAQVALPALSATNTVALATNVQRFNWCEVPLKPVREPLDRQDQPPMPPGMTNR